ncbi:MAG: hypothetical protein LLF92_01065 [Planctomycetaceae bacterium]|nr:hypothetical protein [Planctomycetaceae bacterium]
MKKVFLFSTIICFIAIITGCQDFAKKVKPTDSKITSDNNFPQIMIGVWEAQKGKVRWGIKFERDGSIKKINHFLAGKVDLDEGGKTLSGSDPNTYAAFVMGPCTSEYDKDAKSLNVKIVLDFYEMKLPNGNLRGRIEDSISGHVSEDGTIWKAEWRSYGWLEDAVPPDINEINANPEKLTFYKIDPTKLDDKNNKAHRIEESNEVRIHFGPY